MNQSMTVSSHRSIGLLYNINANSAQSSYLDLSILYGDTEEDQSWIRTFQDGKIKPDCFMEERVLGMPPGAGVIL